jgi:hypothetical protein
MSHLIIALIIVLIIIVIPSIFIIMNNNKQKKTNKKMLVFFSNLGATYDLSFTGQEILPDKIIGLDGPRKKLLVVEQQDKKYNSHIIDLHEVKTCKVKKIYTAINSDNYKESRVEDFLNSIALEFDFKTEKAPVAVSFYRYGNDSLYEMNNLENKTRHWKTMLSKMLPASEQKSA